jgi:hypothetical protein
MITKLLWLVLLSLHRQRELGVITSAAVKVDAGQDWVRVRPRHVT